MFEREMERLEHALDDALLFYYAAQNDTEKEVLLQRSVEVSLERLQCCLGVIEREEKIDRFAERVLEYMRISDYLLHEGVSKFVRVGNLSKDANWFGFTVRAMQLQSELHRLLKLEQNMTQDYH